MLEGYEVNLNHFTRVNFRLSEGSERSKEIKNFVK